MANHITAEEVATGIYAIKRHKSVQRPTPEMLAGVPQWPEGATYAALVGGVFVALPDSAYDAAMAAKETARIAKLVPTYKADLIRLDTHMRRIGLTYPTAPDRVLARIETLVDGGDDSAAMIGLVIDKLWNTLAPVKADLLAIWDVIKEAE